MGGVVRCSAVVMGVVVVFASPCLRVFDKEGKGREAAVSSFNGCWHCWDGMCGGSKWKKAVMLKVQGEVGVKPDCRWKGRRCQ